MNRPTVLSSRMTLRATVASGSASSPTCHADCVQDAGVVRGGQAECSAQPLAVADHTRWLQALVEQAVAPLIEFLGVEQLDRLRLEHGGEMLARSSSRCGRSRRA